MISNEIREKLQYIIGGALLDGQGDPSTTIRNLLVESVGFDPTVKSEFQSRANRKESQEDFLKSYAESSGLWLLSIPDGSQYLGSGGEFSVYNNLT